jgi:hypothetical protein
MVIFTYGLDFSGGILSGDFFAAVRAHGGAVSGSPPLCFGKVFRFTQDVMTVGIGNLVKHVIHGFLNAGVRPVELARCLGGKLAEHVPVPQGMERVKYTIRTHVRSFSFNENFGLRVTSFVQWVTGRLRLG